MYHLGFIIEQVLGHVTHTHNLQRNVPSDPSIVADWKLIPWDATGWRSKIPVYNSNWTVRAGLRARRAVADLVNIKRPDALFFHTQVPAVFSTAWIKRIPSVVSLDATPLQYDALGAAYDHQRGPNWLEHQKWKLNRDCFHAAHTLVTWSHWAKQSLINDYGVAADKIVVIPPGVNPREWHTPRRAHAGPVNILFVGGNFERKGGHVLLEAFRALRALNIELHVVTRDPLPAEPGVFVYHNLQPNSPQLRRLYAQADLFCLPTKGDCLPMVLSEAGAAGLPVVSTNVAAIPEIVQNGETGFVVPPNDVAALTTALRDLIQSPARRLAQGQRAVEVVAQRFDAQRNAVQLLDVLKAVVDHTQHGERT